MQATCELSAPERTHEVSGRMVPALVGADGGPLQHPSSSLHLDEVFQFPQIGFERRAASKDQLPTSLAHL